MKETLETIISTFLWDSQAVQVSVDTPFRLASGNMSPIYIDCRRLISNPSAYDLITSAAYWVCQSQAIRVEYIAGGESGGIPFAAWLAQRLSKPMVYVRKKAKGHGTASRVEGVLKVGSCVLLYDDLVTDGGSKLSFIEAIRQEGGEIGECLVVFDRQQGGSRKLLDNGVRLFSLCNLDVVLRLGHEQHYIDSDTLKSVASYLEDPRVWHVAHGYEFHGVA